MRYGCIETVKEGLGSLLPRGFLGDNKNGNIKESIKKCLPSSFLRSDSDEMTGLPTLDAIENNINSLQINETNEIIITLYMLEYHLYTGEDKDKIIEIIDSIEDLRVKKMFIGYFLPFLWENKNFLDLVLEVLNSSDNEISANYTLSQDSKQLTKVKFGPKGTQIEYLKYPQVWSESTGLQSISFLDLLTDRLEQLYNKSDKNEVKKKVLAIISKIMDVQKELSERTKKQIISILEKAAYEGREETVKAVLEKFSVEDLIKLLINENLQKSVSNVLDERIKDNKFSLEDIQTALTYATDPLLKNKIKNMIIKKIETGETGILLLINECWDKLPNKDEILDKIKENLEKFVARTEDKAQIFSIVGKAAYEGRKEKVKAVLEKFSVEDLIAEISNPKLGALVKDVLNRMIENDKVSIKQIHKMCEHLNKKEKAVLGKSIGVLVQKKINNKDYPTVLKLTQFWEILPADDKEAVLKKIEQNFPDFVSTENNKEAVIKILEKAASEGKEEIKTILEKFSVEDWIKLLLNVTRDQKLKSAIVPVLTQKILNEPSQLQILMEKWDTTKNPWVEEVLSKFVQRYSLIKLIKTKGLPFSTRLRLVRWKLRGMMLRRQKNKFSS